MSAFALCSPAGMLCYVCNRDTDPKVSRMLPTYSIGADLSIAVTICPECEARALEQDGTTDVLFNDIREAYALGFNNVALVESEPMTQPESIRLKRRPLGSYPRRHPAYGKVIAENPPPPDAALTVAVGWDVAKTLPQPLLVVMPQDAVGRLQFGCAEGRHVRVAHQASADADKLLKLAQVLIDFGALSIELVVHPPRPGANGVESLLVVPEAEA